TPLPDFRSLENFASCNRTVIHQFLATFRLIERRNILELGFTEHPCISQRGFLFEIAATRSQSQGRLVDNSIDFRLQVRVFLDQLSLKSTNRLRQDGVELKRDTRGSDRS